MLRYNMSKLSKKQDNRPQSRTLEDSIEESPRTRVKMAPISEQPVASYDVPAYNASAKPAILAFIDERHGFHRTALDLLIHEKIPYQLVPTNGGHPTVGYGSRLYRGTPRIKDFIEWYRQNE
jgi:hypothetical protein